MEELNKLQDFLATYITDEDTADLIIKGGEQGFYYGGAGFLTYDPDDTEDMTAFNEAVEDGYYLTIDDTALHYKYVIGSLK